MGRTPPPPPGASNIEFSFCIQKEHPEALQIYRNNTLKLIQIHVLLRGIPFPYAWLSVKKMVADVINNSSPWYQPLSPSHVAWCTYMLHAFILCFSCHSFGFQFILSYKLRFIFFSVCYFVWIIFCQWWPVEFYIIFYFWWVLSAFKKEDALAIKWTSNLNLIPQLPLSWYTPEQCLHFSISIMAVLLPWDSLATDKVEQNTNREQWWEKVTMQYAYLS